jgi:D-methionine transport system substrate-binding protein
MQKAWRPKALNLGKLARFAMAVFVAALLLAILIACDAPTYAEQDSGGLNTEYRSLRVGATPAPHAEILEFLTLSLRAEGILLDVVEYRDYEQPNIDLAAGDIDANYFQHVPFLEAFNNEHETMLSPMVAVHFEPLGIYPGKVDSLDSVPQAARIAIPNDPANVGRSLVLLERVGLIELAQQSNIFATIDDIVRNDLEIELVEKDAGQIVYEIADYDLAIINGNFAIAYDLDFSSTLAHEEKGSDAQLRYANVLVTNTDRVMDDDILALARALNSEALRTFISDRYQGRVIPAF